MGGPRTTWYEPEITPGTYWTHGRLRGSGYRLGFDINGGAAHVLTGPMAIMDLVEIGVDLAFTDGSKILKFSGEFHDYTGPNRYACTALMYTSGAVDAGIPQEKLCEWAVVDYDIVNSNDEGVPPSPLMFTVSNEKGEKKSLYLTRSMALKPFRVNLWGRNFTVTFHEISPYDAALRSVELQGKYFGGVN
jgi:hypothetical protein